MNFVAGNKLLSSTLLSSTNWLEIETRRFSSVVDFMLKDLFSFADLHVRCTWKRIPKYMLQAFKKDFVCDTTFSTIRSSRLSVCRSVHISLYRNPLLLIQWQFFHSASTPYSSVLFFIFFLLSFSYPLIIMTKKKNRRKNRYNRCEIHEDIYSRCISALSIRFCAQRVNSLAKYSHLCLDIFFREHFVQHVYT